eukprot:SAG11_NODE_2117_length_3792_cov_2.955321_6_plen_88_part_00
MNECTRTNSCRKAAAVQAPPSRPLPVERSWKAAGDSSARVRVCARVWLFVMTSFKTHKWRLGVTFELSDQTPHRRAWLNIQKLCSWS